MSDPTDRRLQRAVQHVTAHWFPINEVVLQRVRSGLASGAYDLDVAFLFRDLKEDFALLTFCVKELQRLAAKENLPAGIAYDPYKLIQWAGAERIKEVIGLHKPLSTHSLMSNEEYHDARLRETAISASTTEALSQARDLDPDQGFTHCVVRQVGLNLIAWNYPTVYARALKALTPRTTIDQELTKALGFSPTLLATVIMKPVRKDAPPMPPEFKETWRVLDEFCEIGEALARANDPETYPSAEEDWHGARKHIEKHLGSRGIELIHRRIVDNTAQYRLACPEAFTVMHTFNPEVALNRHRDSALAKSNPFLKQIPEPLRSKLKDVYGMFVNDTVSREALSQLIKNVIPAGGFTGGCVFLLDPTSGSLFPQVKIGRVHLRELNAVAWRAPVPESIIVDAFPGNQRLPVDMVATAYECENPILEQGGDDGTGESYVALAGVVGRERRVGVLYLELPTEKVDSGSSGSLTVFKAIRHTLADALKVS